MSPENASYSSRRTNRRIAETNPIEGGANILTTKNGGNTNNNNTEAMKLYEAIIFSGPIVFTLIILFLFYFFYLRRSVDWSSLRMRPSTSAAATAATDDVEVVELGLKKEFREMLPIIVYKESFSVKDTSSLLRAIQWPYVDLFPRCSVCLGDYQAEDKLQQIPGCGHTFHRNCIDHWLANHTTCPLCRLSLISPSKTPPTSEPDSLESQDQADLSNDSTENGDDIPQQNRLQVLSVQTIV